MGDLLILDPVPLTLDYLKIKARDNMDQPATYEIRMNGHLDAKCNSWVDGAAITTESQDDGSSITTLTVVTANQRQLHGLIIRIRDLCLPILSVIRIGKDRNTNTI